MPTPELLTVGQRLFWAYANLGMAEKAVHDRQPRYGPVHYMIRAKLYREMTAGRSSPRSMMRDQKIRMWLPQECLYCASTLNLSLDHVIPTARGGKDSGDNALWACRPCNSSKSDRDLFEWWFATRAGFPPLFAVRIYLKQAIAFYEEASQLDGPLTGADGSLFDISRIPVNFPSPDTLTFSSWHARRGPLTDNESDG